MNTSTEHADPDYLAWRANYVNDRTDAFSIAMVQAAASLSANAPANFESNVARVLKAFVALRSSPDVLDAAALHVPDSTA